MGKEHKKFRQEQWTEDGNTKGPLFEWRKGGRREGAGIHPTLNDVDTDKPNQTEPMNNFVDDADLYEDYALLLPNNDVDCKKIILRSICDVLLESKKDAESVALFVGTDSKSSSKIHEEYFRYLAD